MKNEDQHIDKLFQKLKGDSFEAPASFMNDLKLRLDAKKAVKKRKFIFWFFLMSLVLVGIASVTIYVLQGSSTNESSTAIAQAEENSDGNISFKGSRAVNTKNALGIDSLNPSRNTTTKKNDTKSENILPSSEKLNGGNKKTNESDIKIGASSKTKKNSKTSHPKRGTNTRTSKPIKAQITKIQSQEKLKKYSRQKENKLSKTKTKNLDIASNSSSREYNQNSNDTSASTFSGDGSDGKETSQSTNSGNSKENASGNQVDLPKMTMKQPAFNSFTLSLEKNPTTLTTNLKENNIKPSKQFEIDMQVYGGILSTTSVFDPTPSADNFQSAQLFSPSFGLKTNVLYKNIYGSVGAEYFKTGDKLTFNSIEYLQTGVDSVFLGSILDSVFIDTIWVLFQQPIYQLDPVFDSVRVRNTIRNQYSWLSIPVSFGYRFKVKSWDIIPNIGMNFNFGVANNQGEYPTSNNQKIQYDAVRFNMDIRIQTEVRKNFGNYYVFASPYFRRHLQPIVSNPSLRLTQDNWGINIGAGIKF